MTELIASITSVFTAAIGWVGTTASTIAAQPILSFLPVWPVGQLLKMHFQSACLSSSFSQILTVMLSAVGCVNRYASTHFGMSFSGMTG